MSSSRDGGGHLWWDSDFPGFSAAEAKKTEWNEQRGSGVFVVGAWDTRRSRPSVTGPE